ncbi:hypothetical protein GCM10007879_17410 [Maritalea porphyrae]|uniref:Uncharacterized protein n=1 Tax=Maritalea porphyrae TaxID=880732 RepID=A0ABQ5US61_9HYPH|nr:hypothetical protein GCM10007879_17410 [Maritalea porphyrae]
MAPTANIKRALIAELMAIRLEIFSDFSVAKLGNVKEIFGGFTWFPPHQIQLQTKR